MKVLNEASSANCKVQTSGVALALWVLRDKCPDEWLVSFWNGAGTENEIIRSQLLNAAYNGIARRVR